MVIKVSRVLYGYLKCPKLNEMVSSSACLQCIYHTDGVVGIEFIGSIICDGVPIKQEGLISLDPYKKKDN